MTSPHHQGAEGKNRLATSRVTKEFASGNTTMGKAAIATGRPDELMFSSNRGSRNKWAAFVVLMSLFVFMTVAPGAGAAGVVMRVSTSSSNTQANLDSYESPISADGRFIAFQSSASNLVSGDTNGTYDVFVKDAQTGATTRVSTDSSGAQANSHSDLPAISTDSRYVAFRSAASNLVPGDTNGNDDVFIKDTQTGTTTRVSTSSSGTEGNGVSLLPSISADGRYVAFESEASNLVLGDTNGTYDVFVKNTQTGATIRVSTDSSGIQGNSHSWSPTISDDGRYVAFYSWSDNVVQGDFNGHGDDFVKDTQTEATIRVSTDSSGAEANGESWDPSISADGRYVAFGSGASNLVTGDTNGSRDVFVKDTQTGATTRVSTDSSGTQANGYTGYTYRLSISADGHYIVFDSDASNLVPGDTNGKEDIFVKNTHTGVTTRVSTDSNGAQANDFSNWPSISADGRHVAFASDASNLVPGDTNGSRDVFLSPILNNQQDTNWSTFTLPASYSANRSKIEGGLLDTDAAGSDPGLLQLADGRTLLVYTAQRSTDLTKYVYYRLSSDGLNWSTPKKIATTPGADQGPTAAQLPTGEVVVAYPESSISPELNLIDTVKVVSTSVSSLDDPAAWSASRTVADPGNNQDIMPSVTTRGSDLYVAYTRNMETIMVTKSSDKGYYWNPPSAAYDDPAQEDSKPSFKALMDGTLLIAFRCDSDICAVRSTDGGVTWSSRIDVYTDPLSAETYPNLVALRDGELWAAFTTGSNIKLVKSHDDGLSWGDEEWISQGSDAEMWPALAQRNAGPSNGAVMAIWMGQDQYKSAVLWTSLKYPEAVDRISTNFGGVDANAASSQAAASNDGRYVTFASSASNLVASDTNGASDVFRKDTQTGDIARVSSSSSAAQANGPSQEPSISADGRYVAFSSEATNLSAGDTDGGASDIFLKNMDTGELKCLTCAGTEESTQPAISADARYVAFVGQAGPWDEKDIYRVEVQTSVVKRLSPGGNGDSYDPAINADGKYVAFTSEADNLNYVNGVVVPDLNASKDVFKVDASQASPKPALVSSDSQELQSNADSFEPDISSDGRYVVFISCASNWLIDPQDTNSFCDAFIKDTTGTPKTTRTVSVGSAQANNHSSSPSVSGDGRFVAFSSAASNLVSGDINGKKDIFIRDLGKNSTRTARATDVVFPHIESSGDSTLPVLSKDGRKVAFASLASNLVWNDVNGVLDILSSLNLR